MWRPRRRLLGGVTDKVFRAIATPLLIIRSRGDEEHFAGLGLERVIVPLDGSPLAAQSLPHAVALARGLSLTALLVRVSDHHGEAQCRAYLSEVADSLREQGVASVEKLVLDGNPAEAVAAIAEGRRGTWWR